MTTGITQERILQLTLSAWSDCGTRAAIEIAAKEAYAAGCQAKQQGRIEVES